MDKELYTNEINELIKSRIEFINRNYPQLRQAFRSSYDWPEMDTLRHEICICLIFGLHQAAITLTNHLLESLLKNALITYQGILASRQESKPIQQSVESFVSLFRPSRKKYGSNDLGDNINQACSIGLIDKEQKRDLHQIRESMRNPYSHADKDKTFGDQTISAQSVRIEEGKFVAEKPEKTLIAELTIAHGLVQAMQAEQDALPYFLDMDGLVRQIRDKLFGPPNMGGSGADASDYQKTKPTT